MAEKQSRRPQRGAGERLPSGHYFRVADAWIVGDLVGKKVPVTLCSRAILRRAQTFAILLLYGQTVEPRADEDLN